MRAILIADPAQAKALKPALKKAGLMVEVVDTLDRADFRLKTGSFEVVLVDQQAREVVPMLAAWRSRGVKADIVVLLPSTSSYLERTRCLDAGADVCLTHPFDLEELSAHLRALTRRNRVLSEQTLLVHDLEINRDARTVHRAGRTIDLTPREFDLLHLLAMRQGKVLTQAILRSQLFEGADPVSSNIVSVYICRLREKIDEGFDRPLILTRSGQGYLMRPEEDSEE